MRLVAEVGRLARQLFVVLRRELDAATLCFAAGLASAGYGASLIYRPAGFLVVGVVLLWWTLPTRPVFVERPPTK